MGGQPSTFQPNLPPDIIGYLLRPSPWINLRFLFRIASVCHEWRTIALSRGPEWRQELLRTFELYEDEADDTAEWSLFVLLLFYSLAAVKGSEYHRLLLPFSPVHSWRSSHGMHLKHNPILE